MSSIDINEVTLDRYSRKYYLDAIKDFTISLPVGMAKPRMKKADFRSFFLNFHNSDPTHIVFQVSINPPNLVTPTANPGGLNPLFCAPAQSIPIISNAQCLQIWQNSFLALQQSKHNFQLTEHLTDTVLHQVPSGEGIVLQYNGDLYIFRTNLANGAAIAVNLVSKRFDVTILDDYDLPLLTAVMHLTPTAAQRFQDLSNQGGAFFFDKRSVVALTQNSGLAGSFSNSSSSTSIPTGLADALQDAGGGAAKQTLRGRNLTIMAASSLSDAGQIVRDTGIPIIFNRLKYPDQSKLDTWGLPCFITQLQPGHLFDLIFSWRSVDLNYFAGLEDRFGKVQAEKFAAKFELLGKTEIDKTIQVSLNLVGNDITRYQRALMGYGFVLDSMFSFKPIIQQAIIATLTSAVQFVIPWMRGNQDDTTGKMFMAVTSVFMDGFQRAYGYIFATQSVLDENYVASLLTGIPTADRRQELIVEMQRLSLESSNKERSRKSQDDDITPPSKKKKPSPPDTKKITAAKHSPKPSNASKRYLCGYFNSTEGCKKIDDCERIHAKPTTPEEEEAMSYFFQKRPKLKRD